MTEAESREKFEAWIVQHCAPLVRENDVLPRSQDGRYMQFIVEDNWQAWQAALAAAPLAQQEPPAEWINAVAKAIGLSYATAKETIQTVLECAPDAPETPK